jgi:F-type H+-transporting ATPase subunit epsilon
MFHVTIINAKQVLFEGDAESVFFPGDQGEFEVLSYHAPIVSLLKAGEIVVDWKTAVPITGGMMKFLNEDCVVLAEV